MKRLSLIALMVAGLASTSHAILYSFEQITANGNQAVASQLTMDVTQSGSTVLFTFNNTGPIASSITDIYWDDDAAVLAAFNTITDGPGVDFEPGASPGNLPGGNNASPPFSATAGLTTDSEPPASPNGIAPGEYLYVYVNLAGGKTYNDVIAALDAGNTRVGMHVQSIGTQGGSEGFVNNGRILVPDASMTVTMLGVALLATAALRRRV
jgi:hypothetical protein